MKRQKGRKRSLVYLQVTDKSCVITEGFTRNGSCSLVQEILSVVLKKQLLGMGRGDKAPRTDVGKLQG